jgi:predicted methyltransferase
MGIALLRRGKRREKKSREEISVELLFEQMKVEKIARIAKLPLEKVIEIKETLQREGRIR